MLKNQIENQTFLMTNSVKWICKLHLKLLDVAGTFKIYFREAGKTEHFKLNRIK